MKIIIKPLSNNQMWRGRRFKTPIYKSFESEYLMKLPSIKMIFTKRLKLDLTFGFSSSLSDIDNPLKPTIDVLQKKYGFNDRHIYEMTVKKEIVPKGSEFIEIQISNLK